ncbi:MAG: helix-turn-helix transcriptional regulator [Acidimicrobiales bacterium]
MSRPTAGERVRRLLALVPWVTANSPVGIDEVCERFGITRKALLADLDVVNFVGVPPYSPDTMITVDIDDNDQISVALTEPFDRPLRLTEPEALAMVAAGRSIRTVTGADSGDALQRALTKLASALGVDPDQVHIDLGGAVDETLATILTAVDERRSVDIDYYTHGRDERSERVIDPHRVIADSGNWYVVAWCHRSDDMRVFRVDRMSRATLLEATFEEVTEVPEWDRYMPAGSDPRITVDLDPAAGWVTERYPCDQVDELADGRLRIRLPVSARPWLERLLVTLGPQARVVEGPEALTVAGVDAAERILARYTAP